MIRSLRSVERRAGGSAREPVATMACLKRIFWGSSPSIRSVLRVLEDAAPADHLDRPWPCATAASPRASLPTTRSCFHFRSGSSEMRGSPKSTPNSLGALRLAEDRGHVQERLARGCSPRRGRPRPGAGPRRRPRSRARARRSGRRPSSRPGRRPPRPRPPRRTRSPMTMAHELPAGAARASRAAATISVAKRAPSAPSATRWSKVRVSGSRSRGTIWPCAHHRLLAGARHARGWRPRGS